MAAKQFPKSWPPLVVREFEDIKQAYRVLRDLVRALDDLRRKILEVGNDHAALIDAAKTAAPTFTSSDQTVAIDTRLEIAHSLGAKPSLVQVTLKCTTANANYSVGDEILWGGSRNSVTNNGVNFFFNATNISIIQGDNIDVLDHNTPFAAITITPSSWRWVVRAWK